MGYADNDSPQAAASAAAAAALPGRDAIGTVNGLIGILVRVVGLSLLAVGLWIAAMVVVEAWSLYRDPGRIIPFATALEQGTQVDALVRSLAADPNQQADATTPAPQLSISFLLAWFVVPALLLIAGSLAMSAVRVGGQLALGIGSRR
jgi:hypothetical protein